MDDTSINDHANIPDVVRVRTTRRWGSRCCVGVLLILGIAILWRYDFELSQILRTTKLPSDLGKMIMHSEVLSHGCGALIIVGSLGWMDRVRRKQLWLLIVLALLSGLAVDVVKLGFPRIRPNSDFDSLVTNASESWVNADSNMLNSSDLSFPSAHAAVGFTVCFGLARLYPAGCWIFVILCGMTGLQRVICGAHYPTDVVAGMMIGGMIYYTASKIPWLQRAVATHSSDEMASTQPLEPRPVRAAAAAHNPSASRVA